MKYLRLSLSSLLLAVGLLVAGMQLAPAVMASASDDACQGIGGRIVRGECVVGSDGPTVESIVVTVVNVLSIVVGIVAVVMIIFGGFRYVTAGGDSGKVSSARSTIIYAIVGLVIVALAQFIVQFVVDRVTTDPDARLPVASIYKN